MRNALGQHDDSNGSREIVCREEQLYLIANPRFVVCVAHATGRQCGIIKVEMMHGGSESLVMGEDLVAMTRLQIIVIIVDDEDVLFCELGVGGKRHDGKHKAGPSDREGGFHERGGAQDGVAAGIQQAVGLR